MDASLLNILNQRSKNQTDWLAYIFLQNGKKESAILTYGEIERQAKAITVIQSWRARIL